MRSTSTQRYLRELSDISSNATGMSEQGNGKLQATIAGLRLCNQAQRQVIANLEGYQRTVLGLDRREESTPSGFPGGYGAELEYLHSRRNALDSLIAAVEHYGAVAGQASSRDSGS